MSGEEEEEQQPSTKVFWESVQRGDAQGWWKLISQILVKLGVGPSSAQRVLQALNEKGIETWGALLGFVRGKEEDDNAMRTFIEAIGLENYEASGRALWTAVQEYKEKGKGKVQGTVPELSSALLSHTAKFFHEQISVELDELGTEFEQEEVRQLFKRLKQSPDPEGRSKEFLLKLARRLDPLESSLNELLIRTEIQETLSKLLKYVESEKGHGSAAMVIGSKGCGKSTIGKLLVILLACSNRAVFYKSHKERILIVPQKASQEDRRVIAEPCRDAKVKVPSFEEGHPIVLELLNGPGFDDLDNYWSQNLFLVHDVGNEATLDAVDDLTGPNKRVIVTSPSANKISKLIANNDGRIHYFVVPRWKWSQIQKIPLPEGYPAELLRSRYRRFGGGAVRQILAMPGPDDSKTSSPEQRQDTQIEAVDIGLLRKILLAQYDTLPTRTEKNKDPLGGQLDLIYAVEPANRRHLLYEIRIASKFVARALIQRYVLGRLDEANALVDLMENAPQLGRLVCTVFESTFHKAITTKGSKSQFNILRLNHGDCTFIRGPVDSVRLERVEMFRSLPSLTRIELNVLYIPTDTTYKTIDSFAIVERKFVGEHFPGHPAFGDENVKYFLIFFQATISRAHVVDGPFLESQAEQIAKLPLQVSFGTSDCVSPKVLPYFLVFATVKDGVKTRQNVTKKVLLNPALVRMKKSELINKARQLGLPTTNETTGKGLLKRELLNLLSEAETTTSSESKIETPARMVCEDQDKFGPQYSLALVSSADQIMNFLRESDKVVDEEDFPDEEEEVIIVEEDVA